MRLKRLFLSSTWWCFLLTLALLAGSLLEWAPLQMAEGRIFDYLMPYRQEQAESPVAVVAVDEASLRARGEWPWPRILLAELVERLEAEGARTIGLYIPVSEPEGNPGLMEIRNLRQMLRKEARQRKNALFAAIDKKLAKAEKRLDGDARLAAAIGTAGNVVLPLRLLEQPPDDAESPPWAGGIKRHTLASTIKPLDWKGALRRLENPLTAAGGAGSPSFTYALPPARKLAAKARALGHTHFLPEVDGRVRRAQLLAPFQERLVPSFALQVAAVQSGLGLRALSLRDGEEGTGLRLGKRKIPVDRCFRMLIGFGRKEEAIGRYSAADVLAGQVTEEAFRGKAVLVGVTAAGAAVRYPSLLGSATSEVELAARTVADLLGRRHLIRPSWGFLLEGLVLLYFGFLLVAIVPRLPPRFGFLILGVFLFSWYAAAAVLLLRQGLWIQVFPATLLTVAGLGMTLLLRLFSARRNESVELNKMLALSLQSQGMLDLALDKFLQCPVDDAAVRGHLYNLALDFERKRMFSKAQAVYEHILRGGRFKDVSRRLEQLQKADRTLIFGGHKPGADATMLLNSAATKPTLGRYEVLRELGQGAMGTVYLGKDPKINREVAIKTLSYGTIEADQLEEVKSRFFREAEAAGRLSHPNIVTIYDAGEEHDLAYLAMEYLVGTDLCPYCRPGELLPVPKVLEIGAAVAEALDYAHHNGIVHRDIKPANIMLLDSGQVKVADFGIARITTTSQTQTGIVLGTPSYMSPEQVAGKKVDGRSDLFSLGAVLYELLAGEKAFTGDTIATLMFNIANVNYTPLKKAARKVPNCCVALVDRLLAKSSSRRFRSAGEAADQIRACLKEVR